MIYSRVTAVVLAGGRSIRMGRNKALLKLGNKTMIEKVVEPLQTIFENIIIVTNMPKEYSMLKKVKFVSDCVDMEEKNSLVGLYSGLIESKTDHVFVIACDMPFINTKLSEYMVDLLQDEDVIIPFVDGHYQPLYAIYGKRCIPEFEKLFQRRWYKIIDAFQDLKIRKITKEEILELDSSMLCFENINTYEQYLQLKDIFD